MTVQATDRPLKPNGFCCNEYLESAVLGSTALKVNARTVKRRDPTKTTTIQNAFVREINRRFAALLKRLRIGIIDNDAFGLSLNRHLPDLSRELSPGAFAFETDVSKLEEFDKWLVNQIENGVFEVESNGDDFSDDFISQAFRKGQQRAQTEIVKAGGVLTPIDLSLGGVVPSERVAVLFARTFNELNGLADDMKNRMRRVLADGIAAGQGPRQVAREMTKVVDITRKRALVIARTEIVRAHHAGNIAEMKRLGVEGIKVLAEWSTALDDRVCASCAGLEGRVFPIRLIEGLIPLHPNCVLGDTEIAADGMVGATKAVYSGPMIELVLANGRHLSCTSNHMLLTPHGFIMAHALRKGDNVIACSRADTTKTTPDDNNSPSSIKDCVESFAMAAGVSTVSVPASPEYLHGDGVRCNGEINVMFADGLLRGDGKLTINEYRVHRSLQAGHCPDGFNSFRNLGSMLEGLAFAADSSMGLCRERLASFFAYISHPESHGIGPVSCGNPCLFDNADNRGSGAVKSFGDGLHGAAPIKHGDNGLLVQIIDVPTTPVLDRDTRFLEVPLDGIAFDSQLFSDLIDTYSGLIETSCIVKVNARHVIDTPVYDIQTLSTAYIANGIISSNCRCVALPIVEGGLPPDGPPGDKFVTEKSDGTPREGAGDLFEKAVGDRKKPGFTFPNQNPVTNQAEFDKMVTDLVIDKINENITILRGADGEDGDGGSRGLRGFIGPKGIDGEDGVDGQVGLTGNDGAIGDKGDCGVRGYTGATGEIGGSGPRGQEGHIGMRGRPGKQGKIGEPGRRGRPGSDGTIPGHELQKNQKGDVDHIRFQCPDGKYGDWIKINEHTVHFPQDPTGVQDLELKGRRIRFKINGHWTKFIRLGGGGGGGGTTAPMGGGHTIQDEGTPLTQRTNLNFIGPVVTVTDDAGNDASNVNIAARPVPIQFTVGTSTVSSVQSIPLADQVTRVRVEIVTSYNAGAILTLGDGVTVDLIGTVSLLNRPAGTSFEIPQVTPWGAASSVVATVASATVGECIVYVEYGMTTT